MRYIVAWLLVFPSPYCTFSFVVGHVACWPGGAMCCGVSQKHRLLKQACFWRREG